jgi:O-antigen ligase
MAAHVPAYVDAPTRLLRFVTSPALFIVAVLFGAIFDFGSTSAASALFWAALQCACAAYALARRAETLAPPRWLDLAVAGLYLALLALVGLSLAQGLPLPPELAPTTLDRHATLVELVKLVGLGAFCIAGYAVASDEAEGERLFTWILLGGAAYALWAIIMFLQAPAFVHGLEKQLHLERLTGSFLSANTAGSLFGALGCASAVRLFRRVGRKLGSRAPHQHDDLALWGGELRDAALLTVLWIALLLTVSRAALAVSLAVVALFALLELRRYARRRRLKGRAMAFAATAVIAAFAVLLLGSLSSQFQGRFGRLAADAVSRNAIIQAYEPDLAATPMTGHGLGTFPTINAQQITEANFGDLWSLGAAHNILLQWWLELGPVGTGLAALVVLLLGARLMVRATAGRVGRWRAAVALAAGAVLMAHNSVDYSLQVQGISALLALLVGLGLAERSRGDHPVDEA